MYLVEHTRNGRLRSLQKLPKTVLRKRSIDNMHLMDELHFVNGLPFVSPFNWSTDFDVVAFTDRLKCDGKNQALQCFKDDYKTLNPIWFNLERTTMSLKKFDYLFAPDFSMWRDLPTEQLNKYNVYRNRFVTAYWQKCGYKVIPVASWGGYDSFAYCFDGLPQDSVIAVSFTGNRRTAMDLEYWRYGLKRLEDKINPTQIIIYGAETDVPGLRTPLKFVPDYITTHFRKNGKSE
jgi:hypothetical protein